MRDKKVFEEVPLISGLILEGGLRHRTTGTHNDDDKLMPACNALMPGRKCQPEPRTHQAIRTC